MTVWLERLCSPKSRRYGERLSIDDPISTVTTVGVGGAGAGGGDWYWLRDGQGDMSTHAQGAKPAYRIPTMEEIRAIEPNGLSIVSTFSGCGGSCLGFRMAGYGVLWANEFIPAAQETYRANASPTTILSPDDIRTVSGADILNAVGKDVGEIDVLEGSPPCASFSTAGKREKGWGKEKAYSDTVQRADDLFFEYTRLLGDLKPKAFVAENVSGLVKGTAKGYFKMILRAMREQGYIVEAKLLDAQWLGVPQARQRIIFVGIREDLGLVPSHPKPLPYRYSIRDALPEIVIPETAMRYGNVAPFTAKGKPIAIDGPIPTVMGLNEMHAGHQFIATDSLSLGAERRDGAFYDVETGQRIGMDGYAVGDHWEALAPGESDEQYFNLVKPHPDSPISTVTQRGGGHPSVASVTHPIEKRKLTIAELRRLCSFPDDFILTGTYAQRWERLGRSVPPLMAYNVAKAVARTLQEAK